MPKKDRFKRSQKKSHSKFRSRSERKSERKSERRFDVKAEAADPKIGKQKSTIVVLKGEVQKNRKGFAFLLQKPEDLYIPAHLASQLITGDVARVWVNTRSKEVIKLEVAQRNLKSFIGTYQAGFGQRLVILQDNTMTEEVLIKERPNLPGLVHGHKVLVEITKYTPKLEGKIIKSFGPALAPKWDTFSVVVRSQWPQEFSEKANHEAEILSKKIQEDEKADNYKGRKDLREKLFVTIDGKDARDFDDAICVEKTKSGYVLYVAIADVASYVKLNSTLDKEAYERATSVYFPEWVIPMLPEALSNGACSLRPNEEKLTLTCEIHFDFKGNKKSKKIYDSVICSSRRCIYEDVQKEFDEKKPFWSAHFELYQMIKASRVKRGSIDLDLPEAKVILNSDGDTIDIKKQERQDSHRLIEEFMIAANEAVTEIMEENRWPFVYRVHEPPQTEALERFEKLAASLGVKPKIGRSPEPKVFADFMKEIKDVPFAVTLNYFLLRSLKQARYEPINLFHFGLASRAYTHFTSPIRRYPDLMVHRILKRFIRHQSFNEAQRVEIDEYLVEACDHCSKQERKSDDLERKVIRIKKARFMAPKLGEQFKARITNISEKGLYVELIDCFIDGLLPMSEIGEDYFEFIDEKMMLRGKRSGQKFKIGDDIEVIVLRVDIENGFVDFTMSKEKKNYANT